MRAGVSIANFFTVADIDRSARLCEEVSARRILSRAAKTRLSTRIRHPDIHKAVDLIRVRDAQRHWALNWQGP
jgi:hypothetical protein